MKITNYKEAVRFLYHQLPMFQRVGPKAFKTNLDNIRGLVAALGNPEDHFPSVHVAGTNGKGSVSHLLSAFLQSANYRTGLYTSPHYLDFRERIKINGEVVEKEFVVDFVNQLQDLTLKMEPSFFELSVAMAFEYFRQQKVDIAIVETGLGGRLDSTNIITPLLSVITNIGMDHTHFLGNTLEAIAGEKAGIIKAKIPVVIGKTQQETEGIFRDCADDLKSPITFADTLIHTHLKRKDHSYSIMDASLQGKPWITNAEVHLLSGYQAENISTALASILELQKMGFQVNINDITYGLKNLRKLSAFMGRMQILQSDPIILLDSAHNRDGMKLLMEEIRNFDFDNLHVIMGLVNDKDPSGMLSLLPKNASYYLAKANIPRGMDVQELLGHFKKNHLQATAFSNLKAAYTRALELSKPKDMILVCGSIFTVAEILKHAKKYF